MYGMSPDVSYFAKTNFRNKGKRFGIRQTDRLYHLFVVGKTGAGKTTLIENVIRQDSEAGRGLAYIDPHGDSASRIAASVPDHRKQDLIYINAPDSEQPYGCNPIRPVSPDKRALVASGVMAVFKRQWDGNSWGVNLEHILRNALLALLDMPYATLSDISRLLSDEAFRREVTARIKNPQVRVFWEQEFEAAGFNRPSALGPVLNKVGAFLSNPLLFRMLTIPKQQVSFRKVMDERKILIVNLAKGQIGEDASNLLGGFIVTMLTQAAFSRADQPEQERVPFAMFFDEFQNMSTDSFVVAVSELRKMKVSITVATQHLHQIPESTRLAIIGNVGTLIAFRVGVKDAPLLAREFHPVVSQEDLMGQANYHIYLKLMIDGVPSKAFSARAEIY